MTLYTLDSICRSVLLKKRYGLHFYLDCLLAAVHICRELSLDDNKVINSVLLPVNQDLNTAELPAGFVDETGVFAQVGQKLKPLLPDKTINNLQNFDGNFNPIPYTQNDEDSNTNRPLYYGALLGTWWNTTRFNTWGENIGRMFGFGAGNMVDTYKIIRNRNEIQLNEGLFIEKVLMQYISDGLNADAATQVHPYAVATYEAYIMWQLKEHRRDISEGEKERAKQAYINQREILRARNNPLTVELIKRIQQQNTRQSIKS